MVLALLKGICAGDGHKSGGTRKRLYGLVSGKVEGKDGGRARRLEKRNSGGARQTNDHAPQT